MDRRNFFRTMIGGVAAAAAVRTWPFRVYSFPSTLSRVDMLDLRYWGVSQYIEWADKEQRWYLVEQEKREREFYAAMQKYAVVCNPAQIRIPLTFSTATSRGVSLTR